MIRVAVYKIDELIGKVIYTDRGMRFEGGGETFKTFIIELKKGDEYGSDREFIRDLPERLRSYIHAHIEVDD